MAWPQMLLFIDHKYETLQSSCLVFSYHLTSTSTSMDLDSKPSQGVDVINIITMGNIWCLGQEIYRSLILLLLVHFEAMNGCWLAAFKGCI